MACTDNKESIVPSKVHVSGSTISFDGTTEVEVVVDFDDVDAEGTEDGEDEVQ